MAAAVVVAVLYESMAIAAEDRPYLFGVHPYLVPRTMAVAYGPATLDLGEKLGHPVRLLTTSGFDKYADKLRREEYDIAIVQPFDVPRVVGESGYLPLARVDAKLRAIFVVMADSTLQGIAELAGQRVAMAPQEAATSRQGIWALDEAGLQPERDVDVHFLSTHDACLHELLRGAAQACVTGPPPLDEFSQRTGAKMRVLAETAPLPHMAAVVHPRVSAEHREKLRQTMLSWSSSSQGQAILASMGFPAWTDFQAGDYAEIEKHLGTGQEAAAATTEEGLLFGTFPYFQPRRVASHLAPLVDSVTELLQQRVHLRTTTGYDQFEANLQAQKYDLALINPFEFSMALAAQYEPIARFANDLKAHFYVKADGAEQSLADLRGKTVATPPATAVLTLLALEHLRQHGLEPGRDVQIDHRISHDSCLERLSTADAAACVTAPITVELMPEPQFSALRVVDKTASVPSVLLVIHRRHSAELAPRLRAELLSWASRPEKRAALTHLGLGDFAAVDPAAYLALPSQR